MLSKYCRCGQRIIFLKTTHGKIIPVNFEEWIEPEFIFDAKKMVAHFVNCPDADKFRRKGK